MTSSSSLVHLFIGRLSNRVDSEELENIFSIYGKLTRCDVKYGLKMAYAFVDFEDKKDAEDALYSENGREIRGQRIIVEYSKNRRREGEAPDRDRRHQRSGIPRNIRGYDRRTRSSSRGRSRSH